jgi:hypothetical protein
MATLKMASMIKVYDQHGTISEEAKWTFFSCELIFVLYLVKNSHGPVDKQHLNKPISPHQRTIPVSFRISK